MMAKQEVQAQQLISQIKIKGFSLLEVSLVIFLFALVFSLGIPIFSVASNNRLKDLSVKFIALVDYARDQASIQNTPHFLYLDSISGRVFVYRTKEELNSFLSEEEDKENVYQKNKIYIQQIKPLKIDSITYEENDISSISIRFDPSGFSDIFAITFTDGKTFIHYTQTSVLGGFYVSTTR